MKRERGSSSQAAVDLDDLLTRVDNDHDLLRELIGIFKEEFPQLLQSLQASVACEDLQHVKTTSHTLKGMLSAISATRAAEVVSRLEQMAETGEKVGLADTMTTFEREVTGIFRELDVYAAEVKA
jgi:HPt (histidine-containing phosphotransfer) domain-containing protein